MQIDDGYLVSDETIFPRLSTDCVSTSTDSNLSPTLLSRDSSGFGSLTCTSRSASIAVTVSTFVEQLTALPSSRTNYTKPLTLSLVMLGAHSNSDSLQS
jgi:hypothetical protein